MKSLFALRVILIRVESLLGPDMVAILRGVRIGVLVELFLPLIVTRPAMAFLSELQGCCHDAWPLNPARTGRESITSSNPIVTLRRATRSSVTFKIVAVIFGATHG